MLFLTKLSYRRESDALLRHGQITLLIPAGDVSEVADIVEQRLEREPEIRMSGAREFFLDDLIEIDPNRIPASGATLKIALHESDPASGLYRYPSGPDTGCLAYSATDPAADETPEEPYITLE